VTRDQLKVIQDTRTHDPKIVADLKKRKLLKMQKVISFRISKGPKFALEMVKEETDLTAEMLASGAWKTATFKPYNFKALGADQHAGALHPLNKVRHEFRLVVSADAGCVRSDWGRADPWIRLQANLLRDGLHRNAHKPVRRVGILGTRLRCLDSG
jgi:hypothetical protein